MTGVEWDREDADSLRHWIRQGALVGFETWRSASTGSLGIFLMRCLPSDCATLRPGGPPLFRSPSREVGMELFLTWCLGCWEGNGLSLRATIAVLAGGLPEWTGPSFDVLDDLASLEAI